MSRAFVLILLPAAVVGVFYVVVFRSIGADLHFAPFLGAAVAVGAAVWLVRRSQRRKIKRPGSLP